MSTTHPPPETYKNVVHDAHVDGGWSGELRLLVASSNSDELLVFVDSDLLGPRRLVLTPEQAADVAGALAKASAKASLDGSAQLTPKVSHRWEVDALSTEPDAPLTLWRDGQYVAHLDSAGAQALAHVLELRAAEAPLSAPSATL